MSSQPYLMRSCFHRRSLFPSRTFCTLAEKLACSLCSSASNCLARIFACSKFFLRSSLIKSCDCWRLYRIQNNVASSKCSTGPLDVVRTLPRWQIVWVNESGTACSALPNCCDVHVFHDPRQHRAPPRIRPLSESQYPRALGVGRCFNWCEKWWYSGTKGLCFLVCLPKEAAARS